MKVIVAAYDDGRSDGEYDAKLEWPIPVLDEHRTEKTAACAVLCVVLA